MRYFRCFRVGCGALTYAKAHVTAGSALVKHFRLALRSPQELKFSGTTYDGFLATRARLFLAKTHSTKQKQQP